MKNRKQIVVALLAVAAAAISLPGYSAVVVGKRIGPSQRVPVEQIRHNGWEALLKDYVDQRGMVAYARWKKSPDDLRALDDYLNHLSTASISATSDRAATKAFWINAYNAVTIKGILREYPTTSIRNHTPRFFGYNIWDDLHLLVAGKPYSLNQMEHDNLRRMGDPRIHFAIVCASIGCPTLPKTAFVPAKIDAQLSASAQAFFASPERFRFDVEQNDVYLSPILDWFEEDFGATTAEQLRRIAPWAPADAQSLLMGGKARLKYLDYDWGLNDQDPAE